MTRPRLYFGVFPACLLLTLPVALTEGALRVPANWRTQPSSDQADAVVRPLSASWAGAELRAADGALLKGWLFRPRDPNGGAVIVHHGHIDTRKGVLSHAALLLRHGYTVLAPDSRGHGVSGGELITYGVEEADDMRRWSAWLRSLSGIGSVSGLGESMGASVLLQATAEASPFDSIVAEGPYSSFRKIAYDRMSQRFGVPRGAAPFLLFPLVEPGLVYARLRHGVDLGAASPLDALRHSTTPVLLIHGAADTNVPPDHSSDLAAVRPGIALWNPAATGHVAAISTHPHEFEKRVTAWFAAHRAQSGQPRKSIY